MAGESAMAATARPVIVRSLAEATMALEAALVAGRVVCLQSAPDAAHALGPSVVAALFAAARRRVPGAEAVMVIDCGDDAGYALAGLDAGIEAVRFSGHDQAATRLGDIARRTGARLITDPAKATLDLSAEAAPREALGHWIG